MLRFEIDRREEGQGLLEYALIMGLVSIAAVSILALVGIAVLDFFNTVPPAFD